MSISMSSTVTRRQVDTNTSFARRAVAENLQMDPRTLAPRCKDHSLPRVSYREEARSRSNKNDSWNGRPFESATEQEAMIPALFG